MTEALELKSDAELITAVRRGDSDAYGELYERHLGAAKRAAAFLANTSAEREDLVADAFTRVLRALRDGHGPHEEFRAYLLVTMRNAAISTTRGAVVSLYADVPEPYLASFGEDPVLDRWQATAAVNAFASLPERWRMVLWHTEVEDESPATIAPLLGMRPNGVAALAYRAREGLRQAYLRMHLTDVEGNECRATVSKLAGWVRRSVPSPLGRKITKHLDRCPDCRDRAATLTKVNDELRAYLAPLVLGAPLAAAYLPAPAVGGIALAAADAGVTSVVAAKAVAVKTAAAVAIAAAAMTTVASAPAPLPGSPVPSLTTPYSSTSAIVGPPAAPPATTARATRPATPPATASGAPKKPKVAPPEPQKKDKPEKHKPKKDKPTKPDKPKKPMPTGR